MSDWEWKPDLRLPYVEEAGAWQHKDNPDAVSNDGGEHYFLLSERPRYQRHGKIYAS